MTMTCTYRLHTDEPRLCGEPAVIQFWTSGGRQVRACEIHKSPNLIGADALISFEAVE